MKSLLIVIGLGFALPASAQPGVGAKFGSRDPQVCGSTKAGGKGPPDMKVVTAAVLCSNEKLSGTTLYLTEELKVDIATKGRPHNPRTDIMSEIDTGVPVYAIRGSFVSYQCSPVSDYMKNAGKNCNMYRQPQASGLCYKTTFGDWKCSLMDLSNNQQEPGVPPPKK